MKLKAKTVLVLEDKEGERTILCKFLETQGFRVVSARDVLEARDLVWRYGRELDVLLLDMEIENSSLTGADFGLEVRDQLKEWPPEFVIRSIYDYASYYQLAFRLGAATYLRKAEHSLVAVGHHVRALALRRALALGRKQISTTMERISRSSLSGIDAILRFCREVVCTELEITLGTPYLLLVSKGSRTYRLGNSLDLPHQSRAYTWLQELAHLHVPSKPLVVEPAYLPAEVSTEYRTEALELFSLLRHAAFIPLSKTEDFKISLGVLPQRSIDETAAARDALELAKVIGVYFQPALVNHLLAITTKWAGMYAHQRAVLEAASGSCLYIGQEQIALFDRALESGNLSVDDLPPEFTKLRALGEELRDAGELLGEISKLREEEQPESEPASESMADLIREVWLDLTLESPIAEADLLNMVGDCIVSARPDDLYIAVGRLLRWLTLRVIATPARESPYLSVLCRSNSEDAEVIFEDRSDRLPPNLRERLFSLFSTPFLEDSERSERGELLGLYLCKALVEIGNGGILEDRSDEIDGGVGHRFVMRFPQALAFKAA